MHTELAYGLERKKHALHWKGQVGSQPLRTFIGRAGESEGNGVARCCGFLLRHEHAHAPQIENHIRSKRLQHLKQYPAGSILGLETTLQGLAHGTWRPLSLSLSKTHMIRHSTTVPLRRGWRCRPGMEGRGARRRGARRRGPGPRLAARPTARSLSRRSTGPPPP